MKMKRVPYETMVNEFKRVLVKKGFTEDRAEAAAVIFAQNSLAGVYSHGLNRFPRVVEYLEKGRLTRISWLNVNCRWEHLSAGTDTGGLGR